MYQTALQRRRVWERERERESCDGEENASLNKLIIDTLFI